MIEELIQCGDYQQALTMLEDMDDESVRYLRLVCLVGMGEYQQAKTEGAWAKACLLYTSIENLNGYGVLGKERKSH